MSKRDALEATIDVLRAALNVALNSDDPDALDGARLALQEVRSEDLTLMHERDALRAKVNELKDMERIYGVILGWAGSGEVLGYPDAYSTEPSSVFRQGYLAAQEDVLNLMYKEEQ